MSRPRAPVLLGLVVLSACAAPASPPPASPALSPAASPPPAPLPAPPASAEPAPAPSLVETQAHADLRRAAADRTTAARSLLDQAVAARTEAERHALHLRALEAYGLAARAWTSLFALDPGAADAARTRFWIADAWHRIVLVEEAVGGSPSADELASARRAAIAARATSLGPERAAAAGMVVAIADLALRLQHRLHERTRGAQGVAERRELRLSGTGGEAKVMEDPLPREVEEVIAARDAYLEATSPSEDPGGRAERGYEAANLLFLYGHLADARRRLAPLSNPAVCGPPGVGYRAWYRLLSIAALEANVPAYRSLVDARGQHRCNPEGPGPWVPRPGVQVVEAYRLFQKAEKSPPGPEQDKIWRESAALYRQALEAGPDRDDAPESAINGAYAYKQVGAYADALALYRLFLDRYGSDAALARLARGDPGASPPIPPDPRRYHERPRYTQMAAEQLATAQALAFDYAAAAATYGAIARDARLPPAARRDAARNAVLLHTHLGERDRLLAAREVYVRLGPPPDQLADLDWLVARVALEAWDERAPDTGPNRAARLAALAEVERFAARHEAKPEAARWVVHAAHAAARLRRAAGDAQAAAWCQRAVRAFERARAARPDPRVAPEADLAARCLLADLEASLRADFGAPPAPRRYRGDDTAIERAVLADLARAETHARRIDDLARRFGPGPWLSEARVTHAAVIDACRAGLVPLAAAGRLHRVLRTVEEKAARADLEAVVAAGAFHAAAPEARRRLAHLSRILGEQAMAAIAAGIVDPVTGSPFVYREGMFSEPPGRTAVEGDVLPPPRPVVP